MVLMVGRASGQVRASNFIAISIAHWQLSIATIASCLFAQRAHSTRCAT